jgi:hypothetical protein
MAKPEGIEFPRNIRPTSRSYNPGIFPSTDFKSLDGTRTHLRYGNKRVDSSLQLSFTNISDNEAYLILENYRLVNSVWEYVVFDQTSGLAGVGGDGHTMPDESLGNLAAYIDEAPSGLRWRYSGPPTVTSVFPGISNVNCSFVACLDS